MRGWTAVYYRELLLLRSRLMRHLLSMSISPALYLVAFGFGLGRDTMMEGRPYLEFLVPGLVAMNSMFQGYAISTEINVARFNWGIFEEFQAAPISDMAYVFGEAMAGVTRAMLSVAVILVIAAMSGVVLSYGPVFWLAALLNSFLFASLAVGLAMVVRSHVDQVLLSNFVITPMAFLGGTFFSVETMPAWARYALNALPLTHASGAIRAAAFNEPASPWPLLLLFGMALALFALAFRLVRMARD